MPSRCGSTTRCLGSRSPRTCSTGWRLRGPAQPVRAWRWPATCSRRRATWGPEPTWCRRSRSPRPCSASCESAGRLRHMRLLVTGAGLGFVLAAQVGPVTLLIVRSVLRGGRAVAVGVAMAVAVALIDLLHAAVGLAGAGRLLYAGPVPIALGAANPAILAGVAAGTLLWYVGFAVAVAATRRRIGARLLAAIDVAIGAALVLLGALLGERTLTEGRA